MKRSRAWRRTQKERVVNNRMKEMKALGIAKEGWIVIQEPHRMEKKHPLDCGNAQCLLCHHEKNGLGDGYQEEKIAHLVEEEDDSE